MVVGARRYWLGEIVALYAAARLFGASLGVAETILAYVTGYAATRRTLPLGGAGATEALMCAALFWIGLPWARTVPITTAYRAVSLLMPLLPAAHVQRRILGLESDERLGGHRCARKRERLSSFM